MLEANAALKKKPNILKRKSRILERKTDPTVLKYNQVVENMAKQNNFNKNKVLKKDKVEATLVVSCESVAKSIKNEPIEYDPLA